MTKPSRLQKRRRLYIRSLLKTPSAHFPSQLRQKSPRETEDGRLSAVSQIRWPAYHRRTNNKPGPDPAADLDPSQTQKHRSVRLSRSRLGYGVRCSTVS